MMRNILIIGCGGSGKSTLAVKLGKKLGYSVYHLDRIYWKPGWTESSREEFIEKLNVIFQGDDGWIMDGNFGGTMEVRISHSDTIIYLDLPTWVCALGAARRLVTYWGKARPDMAEGNNERFDWDFLGWILSYRRTRRPRVMAMLDNLRETKNVIILQSRNEVDRFVAELTAHQ